MKFFLSGLLFLFLLLASNCGSDGTSNDNIETVAFTKIPSGGNCFEQQSCDIFQMDLKGENVSPLVFKERPTLPWKEQNQLLNLMCANNLDALETEVPIRLISPDGADLGQLDDSWEPAWSLDTFKFAVACGVDEDGTVIIVSNSEHPDLDSIENWSRSSSALLSDRIEIWIYDLRNNQATRLTKNKSGDWLPRWFPYNPLIPNEPLPPLPEAVDLILIESNRNGKSEIFAASTNSTQSWLLSSRIPKSQSPAWSKDGSVVAFSGGELDENKIHLVPFMQTVLDTMETVNPEETTDTTQKEILITKHDGFPIVWDEIFVAGR